MKKIRILIADDHSIIRRGLRTLFSRNPGFTVTAEAGDGREAVEQVRKKRPDIAILDVSMPGMTGIEATRIIREEFPEVRVLILTIYDSEEYVYQMVRAGANGYVLKDASSKELFDAVRAVHAGERFFSPGISRIMIEQFVRRARSGPEVRPAAAQELTPREVEVLRLIAAGLTNPKIAARLFLSVKTVNTHRTNIMNKLNIHETAGLVRYAIQNGLAGLDP